MEWFPYRKPSKKELQRAILRRPLDIVDCQICRKVVYDTVKRECASCRKVCCLDCWEKNKEHIAIEISEEDYYRMETNFMSHYCPECFRKEYGDYIKEQNERNNESGREEEQRQREWERHCEQVERYAKEAEEERIARETSECDCCGERVDSCSIESCSECGKEVCVPCLIQTDNGHYCKKCYVDISENNEGENEHASDYDSLSVSRPSGNFNSFYAPYPDCGYCNTISNYAGYGSHSYLCGTGISGFGFNF